MIPMYSRIILPIVVTLIAWSSKAQDTPAILSYHVACDSIYLNKNYHVTLATLDSTNEDDSTPNTLFSVSRLSGKQYLQVFSDSIFSKTGNVEFADFNNDHIPDILVQNISDVRSNWTYYLYLVDTINNRIKKIEGFEGIKNPVYLPQYDLISNYVMSGKTWTSFYKIHGDTIKDFDIVIYDNQANDSSYDRDYRKAIQSILKREPKRR